MSLLLLLSNPGTNINGTDTGQGEGQATDAQTTSSDPAMFNTVPRSGELPDYVLTYIPPKDPYKAGSQRSVTWILTATEGLSITSLSELVLMFVDPYGIVDYEHGYYTLSGDSNSIRISCNVQFKSAGYYYLKIQVRTPDIDINAEQILINEQTINVVEQFSGSNVPPLVIVPTYSEGYSG